MHDSLMRLNRNTNLKRNCLFQNCLNSLKKEVVNSLPNPTIIQTILPLNLLLSLIYSVISLTVTLPNLPTAKQPKPIHKSESNPKCQQRKNLQFDDKFRISKQSCEVKGSQKESVNQICKLTRILGFPCQKNCEIDGSESENLGDCFNLTNQYH